MHELGFKQLIKHKPESLVTHKLKNISIGFSYGLLILYYKNAK